MKHEIRIVAAASLLWLAGCNRDTERTSTETRAEAGPAQGAATAEVHAPAPALPKAEEILAKAVEAVGGQARLDQIHSFHYQGEITIVDQAIHGKVELWWKDGDFYTTQDVPGIGTIRAGKLGDQIWSQDPITGLRKLEGLEAEQHRWASSLMLAADWKRYFNRAETQGTREAGGKRVYDVLLTADSGSEVRLTFDAESYLQVEQKFDQVTPLGTAPLQARLEDYRDVEGLKVAFKQVTETSLANAVQQIATLDLNPEIDTASFAMPTQGVEVVDGATKEP